REERVGDAFVATFEGAQARVLTEGDEALKQWDTAAQWERLALIGLTAGLIDRTWRIALDALCEGKRQGHFLADEQVAQFQLADNDIERISAEHLVLDVAIDVEHGKRVEDKLALVRYFTSKQAEACAGRALHLAQLFTPRMVPIARWLIQRAHHLSVFGMAREHEVRLATAGLAAGMSLE
ncbi:MAG TPA: acyl-CoA dehydrogenase family protein, partial [Chloroflexota bacterium]|nr:acyl-CoA dehydrogenase family protein [Chloroflexota bacterium]